MGLAPYGQAHHLVALEKVLHIGDEGRFDLNLGFFRHHREPAGFEMVFRKADGIEMICTGNGEPAGISAGAGHKIKHSSFRFGAICSDHV